MDKKKKYEPMCLGDKIKNLSRTEKEAYVDYLNSDKFASVWYGDKPAPRSSRWEVVGGGIGIRPLPKTTLQEEVDAVDMKSEKMQLAKRDYLAFSAMREELAEKHDATCPHCGTPDMVDFEVPPELEEVLARAVEPLSKVEKEALEMDIFKDLFIVREQCFIWSSALSKNKKEKKNEQDNSH